MSSGEVAHTAATQRSAAFGEPVEDRKSYRVILDDISSGIETTDSFAIKFSLLTKTPISKMKHVVRSLPAAIWSGQGRKRAEQILRLIEEAGGKGSIVEIGNAPPPSVEDPAKPPKGKQACPLCGFPMKEEETHCGFCMTPAGSAEPREHAPEAARRRPAVSPKRIVCYAAVLVAGIALIELLMR